MNDATLRRAERRVKASDVLNLQFTSGQLAIPAGREAANNEKEPLERQKQQCLLICRSLLL
jgi:hypothetical protein